MTRELDPEPPAEYQPFELGRKFFRTPCGCMILIFVGAGLIFAGFGLSYVFF